MVRMLRTMNKTMMTMMSINTDDEEMKNITLLTLQMPVFVVFGLMLALLCC